MKPHPRIRKTIKWGGAAVTVLLAVMWIGSGWWWAEWRAPSETWFLLHEGRFMAGRLFHPGEVVTSIGLGAGRSRFALRPGASRWEGAPAWQIALPLWPLALGCMLITAAAWRLDTLARRRARIGRCPKCNYDRAGLGAGAKCPECGLAPSPPPPLPPFSV